MSVVDLLIAYQQQVNEDVNTQNTEDSVDQDTVGNIGIDLAEILKGELPKQNRFGLSYGVAFPIGGADTDLYYRTNINNFQILRNIDSVWTVLVEVPFGIDLPDGILVGLRTSIIDNIITVSSGAWAINGVKYQKLTQTEFTLDAADASFDRWDLIYADANGDILITTGVATLIPVQPVVPVDCILVDYAYVPAIGAPFLLGGQTVVLNSPEPIPALASAQVADIFSLPWTAGRIAQYGKYGRFAVEQANTYQEVPIKIIKDGSNNPIEYQFNLSSIDSLIHIL